MTRGSYVFVFLSALLTASCLTAASSEVVALDRYVVEGRTANLQPAGSIEMPVTRLRFEPQVDAESRNSAENQADLTIRGGIFENTGLSLAGLGLVDPQTGHYTAELPVPGAMLRGPRVLTGFDHALEGFNATVGTVAFDWREIARTEGRAAVGFGDHSTNFQSLRQAALSGPLGVEAEVSRSESDGTLPNGDHDVFRAAGRVQAASRAGRTQLFAGYQAKFFGWPNLYTPFGVPETENLQTTLYLLSHQIGRRGGDHVAEITAAYRRNKDDYEYNRFVPGQFNPYQHETKTRTLSAGGRSDFGAFALAWHGTAYADEIRSTSLVTGPYRSRSLWKLAAAPEVSWATGEQRFGARAGATYDDGNRVRRAFSPLAELFWESPRRGRLHLGYAETTQLPGYTALASSRTAGLFRGLPVERRGYPSALRERARNFELGYRSDALGDHSVQSAVFHRRQEGLTDWTFQFASQAARSANLVDIDTVGAEIFLRSRWSPSLETTLGYTWLDKSADYRGVAADASFYALNYARHRLTAAFLWRPIEALEFRFDNEARWQRDNPLRRSGGDETVTSALSLHYRPAAVRGLDLSVVVDNLWETNFEELPAVPAGDRQISAVVAYSW